MKVKIRVKIKKSPFVIVLFLLLVLAVILYHSVSGNAQKRETLVAWSPSIKPVDSITQRPSACSTANQNAVLSRSSGLDVLGGSGGTAKESPKYSYYSRGWSADDQWWLLSGISTQGYHKIELTFYIKGSDTGPKYFALEYSPDGNEWRPLAESNNTLIVYAVNADNKFHQQGPYLLSNVVDNADTLFIRFINTDKKAVSGSTVQSSGTNYIANITVTALPIGTAR